MAIAALSVGPAGDTPAVQRTRALGVAIRFAIGHALLLAIGAGAFVALGWLDPGWLIYAAGGTAIVWVAHADNIARLLAGTERRLGGSPH